MTSSFKSSFVLAIQAALLGCGALSAHGQFLRLGPFDFEAQTRIEGVYTTNVEEERPSEATAEREDYYLVWGLDLRSDRQISARTRLFIDTGIAIEKHFVREDLDNSENPFGRFDIRFISDWEPVQIYGGALWERTSESVDDKFVPKGDEPRKDRQVGDTKEYIIGTDVSFTYLKLGASYEYTEERYDDEKFAEDENNEGNIIYYFEIIPHEYISLKYEMDSTKTDFINQKDGEGDWIDDEELTLNIDINELFNLWERPKVTYSIGVQREDEQLENKETEEEEGWEFIHRLAITDEFQPSPTLQWKYFFLYNYEDNVEEDDIDYEYGVNISHDLTKRVNHRFTASRSPVETLGSNQDTDETLYDYILNIKDFMLPNVTGFGSVSYTIDDPIEGETEKIWDYSAGVMHSTLVNARLTREIKYEYTQEDSNLEEEILDEHRVTLTYRYDF